MAVQNFQCDFHLLTGRRQVLTIALYQQESNHPQVALI